jgi:hypothetical protein
MYDLRILLIWFILGMLLYLIVIKPEKQEEQKSKTAESDEVDASHRGLGLFMSKSDIEIVSRLRNFDFIEKYNPVLHSPGNRLWEVLPGNMIFDLGIFPLKMDNEELVLAMIDPFDMNTLDLVRELTGKRIKPVLITNRDFRSISNRFM